MIIICERWSYLRISRTLCCEALVPEQDCSRGVETRTYTLIPWGGIRPLPDPPIPGRPAASLLGGGIPHPQTPPFPVGLRPPKYENS